MKRYDGKIAVVTGASSGIGRRLSLELAQRGATVVGLARRANLLAEVEQELRRSTPASETRTCDVADTDGYRSVLADVEERHGRIDVLVNNAAMGESVETAKGDVDDYRRLFETNFFAVVAGTLAVLPGMLDRGSGVVVNVSSDSARAPTPGEAAYSASKAALSAFTEGIAHEVAGKGVSLHVLYPGWVPTAMGMGAVDEGMQLPPKIVRRTEQQIADLVCERMGSPALELNAARIAVLAPLARAFAPRLYRKAIAGQGTGAPS